MTRNVIGAAMFAVIAGTAAAAKAQQANPIAAQQVFLTKSTQLHQNIDASSDEIRNHVAQAQAAFAAAVKRQAEVSSPDWTAASAEPLRLGAALSFAYGAARIIGTPNKLYAFMDLMVTCLELTEAAKVKTGNDPKTQQLLDEAASALNKTKSVAIRLKLLIAERETLVTEAQSGGLLPGITYDSKTGAGTVASPARAVTQSGPSPAAPGDDTVRLGDWKIITDKGRLVAMAVRKGPASTDGGHLAGIRLECVAGGRLEYKPVSLKGLFQPLGALWVHGIDDNIQVIPLPQGRVNGAGNALLSKEFSRIESFANRGRPSAWTVEMGVGGQDRLMQEIKMTGFSQMHAYMLANCKT